MQGAFLLISALICGISTSPTPMSDDRVNITQPFQDAHMMDQDSDRFTRQNPSDNNSDAVRYFRTPDSETDLFDDSDSDNGRYKRQFDFYDDSEFNSDYDGLNAHQIDLYGDDDRNSEDINNGFLVSDNGRYKRQVNFYDDSELNSDFNDRKKRQIDMDAKDNNANSNNGRYKRHINFYEHTYHRGELAQLYLHSGACINMLYFNDKISSLNTHGECVLLYEHENCSGRHLLVKPGDGCHFNLEECDFNDLVTSVRPC